MESFLAKEAATKKHENSFSVLDENIIIQIKGIKNDDEGILILGDTNIPWGWDPVIRKKIQKKIYISLPELDARKVMFELYFKGTPNILTDEQ